MSAQDHISPFGPRRNDRLPEDKLMAYLAGTLSPAEQHDVELWLAEEGMESDALEGLRTGNAQDNNHTINKLKHDLHRKISGKKQRRRPLKADHLSWIAIAIVLLLAVVAYIVIRMVR